MTPTNTTYGSSKIRSEFHKHKHEGRNLRIYGREESKCHKRTYKYTIQHRFVCLGDFVRRYFVHFVSVFLNKMAEMLYPIHNKLSELAYNPCAV
jgi:hypothetical protein